MIIGAKAPLLVLTFRTDVCVLAQSRHKHASVEEMSESESIGTEFYRIGRSIKQNNSKGGEKSALQKRTKVKRQRRDTWMRGPRRRRKRVMAFIFHAGQKIC